MMQAVKVAGIRRASKELSCMLSLWRIPAERDFFRGLDRRRRPRHFEEDDRTALVLEKARPQTVECVLGGNRRPQEQSSRPIVNVGVAFQY
jgi:hypothetical protein